MMIVRLQGEGPLICTAAMCLLVVIDEMQVFAQNLEKAVIETVEAGHMTKDLAICVHGWNVTPDQYLMTEPFMDQIKVRKGRF